MDNDSKIREQEKVRERENFESGEVAVDLVPIILRLRLKFAVKESLCTFLVNENKVETKKCRNGGKRRTKSENSLQAF